MINGIFAFEYFPNYIRIVFIFGSLFLWLLIFLTIINYHSSFFVKGHKKLSLEEALKLLSNKKRLTVKDINNLINLILSKAWMQKNINQLSLLEIKEANLWESITSIIEEYYQIKYSKQTNINALQWIIERIKSIKV